MKNGGRFTKPKALRNGSHLAVLSPASTPKQELVSAGIDQLQSLGYRTTVYPSALAAGPLYYAGAAKQRVEDLHRAFADLSVDGIVCTRGGWGSAELLPMLDASLIKANPKVLVGYSDITSLHTWLANEADLISFYGPMVASDFARRDGVEIDSWTGALHGQVQRLSAAHGIRMLRPGRAEGILQGGCLSILTESLGTPYAPRNASSSPTILFVEDVGTRPYQWDRMLLHLRYSGQMDSVTGVIFGDMVQCVELEEVQLLDDAILHALSWFSGPVAIGLRCGHVNGANLTLPLGVQTRLNLSNFEEPLFEFLEPAVLV